MGGGTWAWDPEGKGTHKACCSRLSPGRPPPSCPEDCDLAQLRCHVHTHTHTRAHGTRPGQNPIAGSTAPSAAAHTHPVMAGRSRVTLSAQGLVCAAALLVCGVPIPGNSGDTVTSHLMRGARGPSLGHHGDTGAGEGKSEGSRNPPDRAHSSVRGRPHVMRRWRAQCPPGNWCEVTC